MVKGFEVYDKGKNSYAITIYNGVLDGIQIVHGLGMKKGLYI